MKPLFFISDAHLGCNEPGTIPEREQQLISFLQSLKGTASQLVIGGDFFEFWMEYSDYINKNHFRVLSTLQSLSDSGTDIHYIAGNHDFNLGQFFTNHLGITVHSDRYLTWSGNKKICFMHGDGLSASDWKYRIAKRVIRNPLNNFLFKLLHPDWGMALARYVGNKSRYAQKDTAPLMHEYETTARSILKEESADVFIQGHLHTPYASHQEDGSFIVNGDWLFALHYISIDNGEVTQSQYQIN
ncbi:MAG: UDP-2,3-diacylglucosamine diphosphatase [Fibrobacterales bacterium]